MTFWFLKAFNFHSRSFIWCHWHSCQIKRHKGSLLWEEDGWQHTCPHKHQTKSFSRRNRTQKSKAVAMHASLRTQSPSGSSKASLTPPYSPYRVWSTSGTGLNFWLHLSLSQFTTVREMHACSPLHLEEIWHISNKQACKSPKMLRNQYLDGIFFYIRSSPSRTFGYIM